MAMRVEGDLVAVKDNSRIPGRVWLGAKRVINEDGELSDPKVNELIQVKYVYPVQLKASIRETRSSIYSLGPRKSNS